MAKEREAVSFVPFDPAHEVFAEPLDHSDVRPPPVRRPLGRTGLSDLDDGAWLDLGDLGEQSRVL